MDAGKEFAFHKLIHKMEIKIYVLECLSMHLTIFSQQCIMIYIYIFIAMNKVIIISYFLYKHHEALCYCFWIVFASSGTRSLSSSESGKFNLGMFSPCHCSTYLTIPSVQLLWLLLFPVCRKWGLSATARFARLIIWTCKVTPSFCRTRRGTQGLCPRSPNSVVEHEHDSGHVIQMNWFLASNMSGSNSLLHFALVM